MKCQIKGSDTQSSMLAHSDEQQIVMPGVRKEVDIFVALTLKQVVCLV